MLKVGNSDHVSLVMEVAIMTITVLQNAALVMEQVRKRINLKLFYNTEKNSILFTQMFGLNEFIGGLDNPFILSMFFRMLDTNSFMKTFFMLKNVNPLEVRGIFCIFVIPK